MNPISKNSIPKVFQAVFAVPAACAIFFSVACEQQGEGNAQLDVVQSAACSENAREVARNVENGGTSFQHKEPTTGMEQGTTESAAANANATDIEAKKADDQKNGGADLVARMHGCGKVPYATLKRYLTSRGVNMANTADGSAGQLFAEGSNALGAPAYKGRIREAMFPSTAAHAKLFDVLVAAANEMKQPLPGGLGAAGGACPGVSVVTAGKFNKDAASCILGTEASEDVMNQVTDIMAGNAGDGVQIAIAALLTSTFTCSVQ
jgi:hypothetical protein